jgi:hypothetical protein
MHAGPRPVTLQDETRLAVVVGNDILNAWLQSHNPFFGIYRLLYLRLGSFSLHEEPNCDYWQRLSRLKCRTHIAHTIARNPATTAHHCSRHSLLLRGSLYRIFNQTKNAVHSNLDKL